MTIGASIFLIVLGAILTFATDFDVQAVNIPVIGVILMLAGGVGLGLSLAIFGKRRRLGPTREVIVDERHTDPVHRI